MFPVYFPQGKEIYQKLLQMTLIKKQTRIRALRLNSFGNSSIKRNYFELLWRT